MDKELKDMTFEELCEVATRDICNALILEGFRGVKSRLYVWLQTAVQWRKAKDDEEKKAKRK